MNVYVQGKTDHGKVWLANPRPWFNGNLMLMFDVNRAEAGVTLKRGNRTLIKKLTDELDQAKVPWVNLRNPRSGVLTICKEDYHFFMMSLDLIGPLPKEIAEDIVCEQRRKSLGLRQSVRYGG